MFTYFLFFFSSRRRHTRLQGDWSSDVCSSDLDRANGRTSGGYPRWWAQDVDPTKLVLPGPLHEPQRYVARYFLYPWWLRREAKRAPLVHILDHSHAHMVTRGQRRPAIVTPPDPMTLILLRSPTPRRP